MFSFSKHPGLKRCQARVRVFAGDTHGNFAIITGLLLLPLVGFSSLAIDHWSVASAKSEIENAADAAALGAINRAAAVMRATGDRRAAIREGQDAGQDQFKGNVGKIANTTTQTPKIIVEINGLEVSSKVEWSSNVKTTFGSLFNWRQQQLASYSASSLTMQAYVQIHVLVDNSSSMGIGATQEEQRKLFDLNKCAIACHLHGDESYTKARKANIKTRIDVVREVLIKVGQRSATSSTLPNQIKMGVYAFSNVLVPIVKVTDPESTDMPLFRKKLERDLSLAAVGGGTDYHGNLKEFASLLPKGGDGSSEQKPLIYAMFITDGIDHPQESPKLHAWKADDDAVSRDGRPILVSPHPNVLNLASHIYDEGRQRMQIDAGWVQPLDDNLCRQIKQKANLSTLEIEYIIPLREYRNKSGGGLDFRFGFIANQILKKEGDYTLSHNRFRKCASTPSDAHIATTDEQINSAINAMFDKVTPRPPRLTN
jgi:Flp pilus assembly protein TadG